MGFEPTTNGTTIRYSNLLSYSHRFRECKNNELYHIFKCAGKLLFTMALKDGFTSRGSDLLSGSTFSRMFKASVKLPFSIPNM